MVVDCVVDWLFFSLADWLSGWVDGWMVGWLLIAWLIRWIVAGVALTRKNCVFYAKKSRLRKSENAMRLLYAKNSDLTHQMRLVFSFFAPSRGL